MKKSLTELDAVPVGDYTDDTEIAEALGRLKALAGVLVNVMGQ